MSCPRRCEIDLEAYLVDPAGEEWRDFREHFPGCEECSAELARLTSFEQTLAEAAGLEHAAPEQLLALAGRGGTLTASERTTLRSHVDACPRCRDSLHAFEGFDFAAIAVPRPEASRSAPEAGGLRAWLADLAAAFAPGTPAFAAASVALVALALVGVYALYAPRGSAPQTPPIAQEIGVPRRPPAPEEPLAPKPPLVAEQGGAPPDPGLTPVEPVVPEVAPSPAPDPSRLAARPEVAPTEPPPTPAPPPDPAPDLPSDAVLIAMASLPSPSYLVPPDAIADVRVHEALRSTGVAQPEVLALAPEHAGRTSDESPTLYWFLDAPIERPTRFTLLDEESGDHLELDLGAAHAAGIHAVSLSDHGVRLESGRLYSWFVSLPRQPEGERPDVLSGGAIERVPRPDAMAEVRTEERANAYAAAGLWYDALAAFSHAVEAGAPVGVRMQRAALLDQGGLADAAAYDRKRAADDARAN